MRKSIRTPTSSSAPPSTRRLEGIIRVSVVATGIDQARIQSGSTDNRIQELTKQLRADTQRLAERIERTEAAGRRARRKRRLPLRR